MSYCKALLFSIGVSVLTAPVMAATQTYNFIQREYSNHAYVIGTFTGDDLNNDGQLVSWQGEVFSISATYSGSDMLPGFTIVNSNPVGSELVYTLNTRWIGDDSGDNGNQEYIWFGQGDFNTGAYYQYLTGYYVQENFCRFDDILCGEVDYFFNGNFLASDASPQYAQIYGSIPEPQSWALLVAGFVLTVAALRRRGRSAATA